MLKLVALVALFAGFCWFGTQVPLGSHTLFGHLHAIAETKESQDLFDGTRESAKPLVNDVRRRIAGAAETSSEAKSEARSEAKAETKRETKSDDDEPDRSATAAGRRPDAGPAQERLTASERRRLRRLISSAEGLSARP